MKMLLLTLLIFSCGKDKDNKNNPKMRLIKIPPKEEIPVKEDPISNDFDGDRLINEEDPRPFVADIPKVDLSFKLWIEDKPYPITFHKNKNWEDLLLKNLTTEYKKKDLWIPLVKEPLKYSKSISIPADIDFVNLELNNPNLAKELEVALTKKDIRYAHFQLLSQENKLNQYSSELLRNRTLHPELINFKTKRGPYQSLIESITQKSYELILVQDQGVYRYYIASKTSIEDALTTLRSFSLDEHTRNRKLFLENDLTFLPDDFRTTFLFNVPSQDLSYRPNTGEQIIIFDTLVERIQKSNNKLDSIRASINNPNFHVKLGNLNSLETIINSKLMIPYQSEELRGCKAQIGPFGTIYLTFKEYSIKYQEKSFKDVFDIFLNKEKVTLSKLSIKFSRDYRNKDNLIKFVSRIPEKNFKVGKGKATPGKKGRVSYSSGCKKKHHLADKLASPQYQGDIIFKMTRPLR